MKDYFRGFISAVRLLTVVPVPGAESVKQTSALYWFPVLGLLIGGGQLGIAYCAGLAPIEWPEATALLLVAFAAFITGGLHLDGLADWADSLGCMGDREKMLRVMKDSRIGSFGVIVLIFIIFAKWIAIVRLITGGRTEFIIFAAILSRTMMVDLAVRQPYTRSEGGTGHGVVSSARPAHFLAAYFQCIVFVLPLGGIKAAVCLLFGIMMAWLLGGWSKRKLGGITGDILGACSELSETAVLVSAGFFAGV